MTLDTVIDTTTSYSQKSLFNGTGPWDTTTTDNTTKTTNSASGFTQSTTVTSKTIDYGTIVGGLYALVGSRISTTVALRNSNEILTFNPFYASRQFTLAAGQEVIDTYSYTTESSGTGVTAGTRADTDRVRYNFVAKETITVLGKTYAACKYESQYLSPAVGDTSTDWFVVGKGVMVKRVIGGATPFLYELKAGDINGVPIGSAPR